MTDTPDNPKPGTALPWHTNPKDAEESFFCDVNILRHDGLAVAVAVHNGDIEPDAVAANAAYIVHACNTLPQVEAERDELAKALGEARRIFVGIALPVPPEFVADGTQAKGRVSTSYKAGRFDRHLGEAEVGYRLIEATLSRITGEDR